MSLKSDFANSINQINSNLGDIWLPYNGYDLFVDKTSAIRVYSTNEYLTPAQGIPSGYNPYGTVVIFPKVAYPFAIYTDVYNNMAICDVNGNWKNYDPNIVRNEFNRTGLLSATCIPWENINFIGYNIGIIFFTNWTGNQSFPENYGSGIVLPCFDTTNKRILYIGQSGKLYSGTCRSDDKSNITWNNP